MNIIRLIIITVLPDEIADLIQRLRAPICKKYQAQWALTYPPHVTLRTGVRVPEDRMEEFLTEFGRHINGSGSFTIRTDKVHHSTMEYEGECKFFLYFPVLQDDGLMQLNHHLLAYQKYRKSDKTSFHPHVTLLWDNLTADEQKEVQAYVDHDARFQVGFEWQCDNVSLYVQQQQQWVPFHIYPL
jgi:2'-5' RNA ligase